MGAHPGRGGTEQPAAQRGPALAAGPRPDGIYAKRQLVPFGEVIPDRGLLSHITSLPALQPVNFTPGHEAVVFHTGKIRLGDVICYEIGFDGLVRSEVTAGANLLTMQTNDADFEVDGQTGESLQQLAMARIGAIESDRAVVVASTTGVSAIVAPDGRLITHSGTWQQAVLEAQVPLITPPDPGGHAGRVAGEHHRHPDGGGAARGGGSQAESSAYGTLTNVIVHSS